MPIVGFFPRDFFIQGISLRDSTNGVLFDKFLENDCFTKQTAVCNRESLQDQSIGKLTTPEVWI